MKAIYTPGLQIGDLTVTKKQGKRYYVTCSCNNDLVLGSAEMKTKANDLITKGFSGCWKCSLKYYRLNRTDVQKYRYIYNAYKKSARDRKIDFNLSRKEFTKMILSECFYCKKEKSNSRKDRLTNKLLRYNGVDRLDNTLGYESDNTVACCSTCNYMKGTQSVSEFIDQVKLIYSNNVQRPSRKGVGSSDPKQETPVVQVLEDDMV